MKIMFEKAGIYSGDIIYKDLQGYEKLIKSRFIISKAKQNENT